MPLSDRELWACANEVMRQHGDRAPLFVAERIGAAPVMRGVLDMART
jgi:hypothetical protein